MLFWDKLYGWLLKDYIEFAVILKQFCSVLIQILSFEIQHVVSDTYLLGKYFSYLLTKL
jgi:hypothetical protein